MLKVHAKNLGTAKVLGLQGQIVNGETEILRDVVQSLSETNGVILDLARVSRVDAHGLGVLLALREWTEKRGIAFELMNVSMPVSRMLEIAQLDSVFEITVGLEFFPTVASQPRVRMAALRSVA
jgi:anti-anti-sigma factor